METQKFAIEEWKQCKETLFSSVFIKPQEGNIVKNGYFNGEDYNKALNICELITSFLQPAHIEITTIDGDIKIVDTTDRPYMLREVENIDDR